MELRVYQAAVDLAGTWRPNDAILRLMRRHVLTRSMVLFRRSVYACLFKHRFRICNRAVFYVPKCHDEFALWRWLGHKSLKFDPHATSSVQPYEPLRHFEMAT